MAHLTKLKILVMHQKSIVGNPEQKAHHHPISLPFTWCIEKLSSHFFYFIIILIDDAFQVSAFLEKMKEDIFQYFANISINIFFSAFSSSSAIPSSFVNIAQFVPICICGTDLGEKLEHIQWTESFVTCKLFVLICLFLFKSLFLF